MVFASSVIMMQKIQEHFYAHIVDSKNLEILAHASSVSDVPSRLSIYRRSIYEKLRRALELTFPSVWHLLGKECANSVAYAFLNQQKNWPTESILDDWGSHFPVFLKEFPSLSHLFYIEDMARLDWLKQLSYKAADHETLNEQLFQNEFVRNPETFRIMFHPSVFLFESSYYLPDIMDLLDNVTTHVTLKESPSFSIIARQHNEVIIQWISHDLFCFLEWCQKGSSLSMSYARTIETYPHFEITAAIDFILRYPLIDSATAANPLI